MTLVTFDPTSMAPKALSVVSEIAAAFPNLHVVYGYATNRGYEHASGLAADFMVYSDKAEGDAIAAYVMANAARLQIEWVIWYQRIWNPSRDAVSVWRDMPDRGSDTDNHKDHVHLFLQAGAYVPPTVAPSDPPVPPKETPVSTPVSPGNIWTGLLTAGRMNSDSVKRLQQRLNQISLPAPGNVTLVANGNYDSATDTVVRAWQKSISDPVDPVGHSSVGPKQAAKMFTGVLGVTLLAGLPPAPTPSFVSYARDYTGAIYGRTHEDTWVHLDPVTYANLGKPKFTQFPSPFVRYERNTAGEIWGITSTGARHHLTPTEFAILGHPAFAQLGGVKAPVPTPKPANPVPSSSVVTPYVGGYISTPFGKRGSLWSLGFHTGDDWPASMGTRLRTTWTCTVVGVYNGGGWGKAYGLHVIIEFRDYSGRVRRQAFCHMSRVDVRVGQRLLPGAQVGLSGNSGHVTGPHLHLEQRVAPYSFSAGSVIKPVY